MSSSPLFSVLCALIGLFGFCACGKKDRKTQLFAAGLTTPLIRNVIREVILPVYFCLTQFGFYDRAILSALMLLVWYLLHRNMHDANAAAVSHVAANVLPTKQNSNAPPPLPLAKHAFTPATTDTTSPAATLSPPNGNTNPTISGTPKPSNAQSSRSTSTAPAPRLTSTSSSRLLKSGPKPTTAVILHQTANKTFNRLTTLPCSRTPKLEKRHTAGIGSDRSATSSNCNTESRHVKLIKPSRRRRTAKQAPRTVGVSSTSKGSDKGAILPSTVSRPAHSVRDQVLRPANIGPVVEPPQQTVRSESAVLDGANSVESDGDVDSTATSDDEYEENDLPSSVGNWPDLVEKMEALSLGVDLRLLKEKYRLSATTFTTPITIPKEETKPPISANPVACLADMLAGLSLDTELCSNWESDSVFVDFPDGSSSINKVEMELPISVDPMESLASTMAAMSLGADTKMREVPIVTPKLENCVPCSETAEQPSESSQHSTPEQQCPSAPEHYARPNSDMDEASAAPNSVSTDIMERSTENSSSSPKNAKPSDASSATCKLDDGGYCSGEADEPTSNTQAPTAEQSLPDGTLPMDLNNMNMSDGTHSWIYFRDTIGINGEAFNPTPDSQQSETGQQALPYPDTGVTTDEEHARPIETAVSALQDSNLDHARITDHGTSNDDDLAWEKDSSPTPYPSSCKNDRSHSSMYSTGSSAPDGNLYWSSTTDAYVRVSGTGKTTRGLYDPQAPSTNSAGPLSLPLLKLIDDVGSQSFDSNAGSENSKELSASISTDIIQASVDGVTEETDDSVPLDTGISEKKILCRQCNNSQVTDDDEQAICFDCLTYGGDPPSKLTALASSPVRDSTGVEEGPRTGSGNNKRRNSVSALEVKTEDVGENIDHTDPTKRSRVGDGYASAVRATWVWDPMYPTQEYEPLKELTVVQADTQIRKWMKRSMRCLQDLAGRWQELRAACHDDTSCSNKLESYIRQPKIYREIQTTYHRLSQLNSHGEAAISHGQLNSVIYNREKVKDIRTQYESIADELENFEDLFDEDFDDIFNGIRNQFLRFMDLTVTV